MPSTTYGTWNNGERTTDNEELRCKNSSKTCILHTYLYGDGTVLCCREMKHLTNAISKDIPQSIMEEHNGQNNEEESHTLHQEFVMNSRNNTAHNTSKPNNTKCRHYRLCLAKCIVLPHEKVTKEANSNRQKCYKKYVTEHTKGIYLNFLSR